MKVINLFSGPGVGKSTAAAGLFAKMKKEGYLVEYVTEYAKDLVYSKSFFKIKDQIYVFAKQQHPLFKLKNQVDYIIMDSPIPLSIVYLDKDNCEFSVKAFTDLVISTFNSYENLNFYIERNLNNTYQSSGRLNSLEESLLLDAEIKSMLIDNKIVYKNISSCSNVEDEIFKNIMINTNAF